MRTRKQIEEFKGMPSVPVYSQNWCEALKIELLLDIREALQVLVIDAANKTDAPVSEKESSGLLGGNLGSQYASVDSVEEGIKVSGEPGYHI